MTTRNVMIATLAARIWDKAEGPPASHEARRYGTVKRESLAGQRQILEIHLRRRKRK